MTRGTNSETLYKSKGINQEKEGFDLCPVRQRKMKDAKKSPDRDTVVKSRKNSLNGPKASADREVSSPKENGKVLLIRRSSESDLLGDEKHGHRVVLQYGLLGAAILLTFHSAYFLHYALYITPEFSLESASRWDQIMLVWCSGWITAASTGLGALPFLGFTKPSNLAVAVCNSIAAGMMLAASVGLIAEGCMEETTPDTILLPALRVLFGIYLGVGFVKGSSYFFGEEDTTEMLESSALSMRRVLIIMAVMTLHSFSEGVGIGVSYHSQSLGGFVSATLAIHNIPEGLAIAIVLIPRGFSLLSTALWCIFSSLPQPLMAVPAFLFTQQFMFVLPIGLGLAGGAMGLVVFSELIPEALEHLSPHKTYSITLLSMFLMGFAQILIRESSF